MNIPTWSTSGLTSKAIDAIKGVAILAVVLGHNSVLIAQYRNLWHVIYAFNIFPFLFLPFLFPARPLTRQYAADRVVRYLVPWAFVYLLCSWLFFLHSRDLTWTEWLADVGWGLIVGTAPLVKAASGFQIFWFLPCLFALVLLRAACSRWPRAGATLVMGAGTFLLVMVGRLPQAPLSYVPATAYVALMMCPVGASLAWICRKSRGTVPRCAVAFVFGSLWLGLSVWIYLFPFNAEHSSLTILKPVSFFVRLGAMMSSFLFLYAASGVLARMPLLVALGRDSLMVYLTSSLWFQVWLRLERVLDWPAWYRESFASRVAASVLFSLAAACLASRLLTENESVRRWVMPRFWGEWPPTAWCPLPGPATVTGHEER